ncbi:glycosyltransferase [Floricoccus tropicus]|uniref:Glycosyltransferase n=1 Tax=Floricoccus tropicus TaxID=1859473 RepID=A0A1E8GPS6_9LACT|nr:glycosyltransferase [Floricoccus tropicus]OFI50254.1 glycosyltransferase [Floricoccus tropicus]
MKIIKKSTSCLLLIIFVIILTGCKGSKDIQGNWKAQNNDGKNVTIQISDKDITVDGNKLEYKQNAVGNKNGLKYKGIMVDDIQYVIVFPEKDKNIAYMMKPESSDDYLYGTLIFAMNKNDYPSYKDYADRYIK